MGIIYRKDLVDWAKRRCQGDGQRKESRAQRLVKTQKGPSLVFWAVKEMWEKDTFRLAKFSQHSFRMK